MKITSYSVEQFAAMNKFKTLSKGLVVYDFTEKEKSAITIGYPLRVEGIGVMVVDEGYMILRVDFKEVTIEEKQVLFLYPNNVVEFLKISEILSFKGIGMTFEFFASLNLRITTGEALDILSSQSSKLISLSESQYFQINHNLRRLSFLNSPANFVVFSKEMIVCTLSLIMYELAMIDQSRTNTKLNNTRKENIALKFTALVGKNFRERKDVQFYADLLLITRTHLTRTIKEVLQKNPKEIIEDKIVSEAKVFLLNPEFTINQIAEELYINDQSAFTKFFKKKTGFTPYAYRKYFQN